MEGQTLPGTIAGTRDTALNNPQSWWPHWVAIPARDTGRTHDEEHTEYDEWCEDCREKSGRQRGEGVVESDSVKWDDEQGLSKKVTGIGAELKGREGRSRVYF